MNEHMAKLMGDAAPPNCPAPWLNLPKFSEFCDDILETFDSVNTKDEFWDLIWSWQNYVNCMNRWFFLIFPWEYGRQLPRREPKDIEEMAELSGLKVVNK